MTAERIPATIVTGFLGAGKTTLVREVINNSGGRRIAVVVNEFGEVGFDGSLVADCDDPTCRPESIVELTNGCICYTVADEFLPTMQMLIGRDPPPDHIIIETSGLALPQPLVRAFSWPDIRHRLTVDGVIAVVDAEAVLDGRFAPDPAAAAEQAEIDPAITHENPVAELFEDQLRCADLIVVTKGDLVAPATLPVLERIVRAEARDGTQIIHTNGKPLAPEVLIGLWSAAEDTMTGRESHHELAGEDDHDHDDFDSFVVGSRPFGSLDALKQAVAGALSEPGVLRIKGRVVVAGKTAPAAVQAVGSRTEAWFSPGTEASGLVVIGHRGVDRRAVARAIG